MKSESEQMNGWCEKWKWTHGQLEGKVKVNTWTIVMKVNKLGNWEKYVWERWGFKWRVEIYMWTVKVKTIQIDEVTKQEK